MKKKPATRKPFNPHTRETTERTMRPLRARVHVLEQELKIQKGRQKYFDSILLAIIGRLGHLEATVFAPARLKRKAR